MGGLAASDFPGPDAERRVSESGAEQLDGRREVKGHFFKVVRLANRGQILVERLLQLFDLARGVDNLQQDVALSDQLLLLADGGAGRLHERDLHLLE